MKKSAPYFGNRLAAAPQSKAKKAKRKSAPEMEALESRMLLSGVGTGLNKKSVTFFDGDGDRVNVNIVGRGATFDISLGGATNRADIANIEINGNGSLGVVVTPVGSFTRPVRTPWIFDPNFDLPAGLQNLQYGNGAAPVIGQKYQTQFFDLTPGYTNIGSITAATGVTQVGNIGLNAAVVGEIDLAGVSVGNLNLGTGNVAKVDATMALNVNTGGPAWTPNLSQIDLYDVTAKSVAGINIAGHSSGVNDFLGDIVVTDGIGRITGTNSSFEGQILVEGKAATIGNIVLGQGWGFGSGISAAGDLTFNAGGFNGLLAVDGHLNLAISGGEFDGTINAGNGISGLRSSTIDVISISNSFVSGEILSEGDIADIFVTNSTLTNSSIASSKAIGDIFLGSGSQLINSTVDATTIGVITSISGALGSNNSIIADDLGGIVVRNGSLTNGNTISVVDTIGLIDVTNGDLSANLNAGTIAEVVVRGGSLTGTLSAKTLTDVSIENGSLSGVLSATEIGDVSIQNGALTGAVIASNDIASITVTNLSTTANSHAVASTAVISAGGDIASIAASALNGDAFNQTSIKASGTIGSISGTAYGTGSAFNTADIVAGTITSISGSSVSGTAIDGLTAVSTLGPIGSISGSGFTGGITGLNASSATTLSVNATTVNGTGLAVSRLIGASIGSVAGTSEFGTGISGVDITATAGDVASITGSGDEGGVTGVNVTATGSITSVSGTATLSGSGVEGLTAVAGASFGSVTGVSFDSSSTSAGLNNVSISAETTIGSISGEGTGASGIIGGRFIAQNGAITSITGSSSDANGSGSGIDGAEFISTQGFVNSITGSAAGSGSGLFAVDVYANLDIASVVGTSFTGTGIAGGTIYTATGNIGTVSGTSANASGFGDGINGLNVRAELGTITSITGSAAGLAAGDGLDSVTLFASNTPVAGLSITGSANGGNGITAGFYLAASGDILLTANTVTGTAISLVNNIEAASGDLTITITASGQGASGIVDSNFTAENILPITVTLPSSQAGTAISNADFTATAGSIGNILVSNSGLGDGIVDSNFNATAGIGSITVAALNDGISGINPGDTSFNADTNNDGTGSIGNILVTSSNGVGIENADFTAAAFGTVTSKVTSAGAAGAALIDSTFTATFGGIGNIEVTNASTSNFSAIESASFTAKTSLASITATAVGGSAILGTDILAQSGDIVGPITAQSASNAAISGGSIEATDGLIGDISANVTSANGGFALNTTVTAGTTIGDITVVSSATADGGTVLGNITAGEGIGAINITSESSASALSATIDADTANSYTVGVVPPTTQGRLESITVLNTGDGSGITSLTIDAATIGNIQVTVNGDSANGIFGTVFTAATSTETALTSGVYNNFGSIGNITVVNNTTTGIGNGITGAQFQAGSAGGASAIGNIEVTMNQITSSLTPGEAIANTTFDVTNGPVGSISNSAIGSTLVSHSGDGGALSSVTYLSNDGVGSLTVTSQGDGLAVVNITADFDSDDVGGIGAVDVTMTGVSGSGIVNSNLSGASIGNIEVDFNLLQTDPTDGIQFLTANASAGTIGSITVGSTFAAGDQGVANSVFTATGNIGAIIIEAVGNGVDITDFVADSDSDFAGIVTSLNSSSEEGTAILDSAILGAGIGAITASVTTVDGADAINNTRFTAYQETANTSGGVNNTGSIGNIIVVNSGSDTTPGAFSNGIVNSSFNAGAAGGATAIGTVSVTVADADSATFSNASFNAANGVTAPTASDNDASDAVVGLVNSIGGSGASSLTVTASSTITGVDSDGSGNQAINLSAITIGSTSPALVADNLANASTVTLTVGAAATSLGAITIDAPAGTDAANIVLNGGSALTTVGAVTVDGNLAVNTNLSALTSLGVFNVGGNVLGGSQIGDATPLTGIAGSNTITINANLVGVNNVTFNLAAAYTGVVTEGGAAVVPAITPGTTQNGATFILV